MSILLNVALGAHPCRISKQTLSEPVVTFVMPTVDDAHVNIFCKSGADILPQFQHNGQSKPRSVSDILLAQKEIGK